MKPEKALAKWQARLRLGDWHIALADKMLPEPENRSQIDLDVRIRSAVIRLDPNMPRSQVERQIVHELLHCRLSGMEDTYKGAKEYTPRSWDDAGDRMWNRAEESAIEALTDALTATRRADWGESGEPWNTAFPPSS